MIAITVDGGTNLQRSLVKQAAWFYVRKLIGLKESEGLSIQIELVKDMFAKEKQRADCMNIDPDDDECAPTEFELRLDASMNMVGLLKSLAHECVHVKQYFLEEMWDSDSGKSTFFGGKWRLNDDDHDDTYYNQPWEIEANGRENGLFARYCKAYDHTKARWNRDLDYA